MFIPHLRAKALFFSVSISKDIVDKIDRKMTETKTVLAISFRDPVTGSYVLEEGERANSSIRWIASTNELVHSYSGNAQACSDKRFRIDGFEADRKRTNVKF